MKASTKFSILLLAFGGVIVCARGQGTAFTYQGRFTASGGPFTGTAEFQFTLWDAASNGTQVATATPGSAFVTVSNGLFTVPIDFGSTPFSGAERWIQVDARTTIGPFTTLQPRQKVTSTPYAIRTANFSGTLGSNQLAGTYSGTVSFSNPSNSFIGSGAGLSNLNAANLVGALPAAALSNAWKLGGNTGTTPGTHFLGTTDNQPLELKANNQRVLRLEQRTISISHPQGTVIYSNAPNVVAGAPLNRVGPGVAGAAIGGGGMDGGYVDPGSGYVFLGSFHNEVSASFSTVGGGARNTIQTNATAAIIGGGQEHTIQTNSQYSTISGGIGNTIETNATESIIGGGAGNRIRYNAFGATIGGGRANIILPGISLATISGGSRNTVGGPYATVPGGENNSALGNYSLAAGQRARANHTGAFVWADSSDPINDFASTAANQFLIRASGGVGIGTDSPRHQLRISGGPFWTSEFWLGAIELDNASAIGWNANAAGHRFGIGQTGGGLYFFASTSDPGTTANSPNYIMTISDDANVGIRTTAPAFTLHVHGSAGKPGGGSWSDSSDARIKKNIQPLSGALDKLTQLRGVSFEWINPADHANQTERQAGFVAQEVEKVFPNWVQEVPGAEHDRKLTPDGRIKSVSLPFEFDALTVEALRELRAENAELKRRLEKLEQLLNAEFTGAAR